MGFSAAPGMRLRQWSTWQTLAVAFLAYAVLALIITFPLIVRLSSHLPKDLGDPLVVTSILWWNAHVVPLTERWWNGLGFFPASGMMAFSEHFLGASIIASPLQWIGLNATTAYNLTFLLSYPLSAVAAHLLAFVLTRRHDAGVVCGLAFAFSPYRIGHVEHLELLLAYGLAGAVAALHMYRTTRRARWLVVFAISLAIQALSTSYYALFFTVFFGLWILWFLRPEDVRVALSLAASAGVAAVVVLPIAAGYSRIHRGYTWRHNLGEEVASFSADLSSFVSASPLSATWGWTASGFNGAERQLFPGLTVAILAIVGVALLVRSRPRTQDRLSRISAVCWLLSATSAIVAISAVTIGPWRIEWAWLTLSVTVPYKPLSVAAVFALLAVGSSNTARAAFRARCPLAFYLAAGGVFLLCSLGPEPTAWGERILYQPPFAWLMGLPFFGDSVRVPARFAILVVLALAVVGALTFDRLARNQGARRALLLVVVAGLVADGWIGGLPLAEVPRSVFQMRESDARAAVMELPLGDVWRDTAAMYRATLHGRRVVNGYNGFEPIYYQTLRRGLIGRDETTLDALASLGRVLIAVDNTASTDRGWHDFLSANRGIRRLREDGQWTMYLLRPEPGHPPAAGCAGKSLPIQSASATRGRLDAGSLTDQNPATRWITSRPPREGESITLDMGGMRRLCGLELSMGSAAVFYPKALRVETSHDGSKWDTAFVGKLGGAALLAALENPHDARISLPLGNQAARFVRLQVAESHATYPWAVAGVAVQSP